jgi:hypothetical protein
MLNPLAVKLMLSPELGRSHVEYFFIYLGIIIGAGEATCSCDLFQPQIGILKKFHALF